jgi:ABC-type lipoprotein release transport system permease subunit
VDLLRTAWRNVWRNPRRSGVTIAAMTLALYVLMLYAGLVAGYLRDMESNIVELEIGDVQIMAPGYRDDPDLYTRIEASEAVVDPLLGRGYRASPRVLAWGLVAAEDSSAGVQFRGVDVTADATVSRVHEHTSEGAWLDPSVPEGAVIGRRLSRMLGVGVGDELVVITQGLDGAMAYELLTVHGILSSIGDATDVAGVFVLEDTLRTLLGVEQGVHQIVVRRPEGTELTAAAAGVRHVAPDLDVRTWQELNPTLASMLQTAQQAIVFMYGIVYAAVAILILNAMLMATFERIREIGVSKALGVGPLRIFGMMVAEAGLQAGIASAIGVALGVPTLFYLARNGLDLSFMGDVSVVGIAMQPIWYPEAGLASYTGPVTALLTITLLAVVFPAWKAARIDPVEALHHR